MNEVKKIASAGWFKGHISDLGGPTANMYGLSCGAADHGEQCRRPSCLFPKICSNLVCDDSRAVDLLRSVRGMKELRTVVVSSGIRYDLLERQPSYFTELAGHHVGGLLKVAPEHLSADVTRQMRKPASELFERFLKRFSLLNRWPGLA